MHLNECVFSNRQEPENVTFLYHARVCNHATSLYQVGPQKLKCREGENSFLSFLFRAFTGSAVYAFLVQQVRSL